MTGWRYATMAKVSKAAWLNLTAFVFFNRAIHSAHLGFVRELVAARYLDQFYSFGTVFIIHFDLRNNLQNSFLTRFGKDLNESLEGAPEIPKQKSGRVVSA